MNLAALLFLLPQSSAFLRNAPKRRSFLLQMTSTVPDFNAVEVAKTGGQGVHWNPGMGNSYCPHANHKVKFSVGCAKMPNQLYLMLQLNNA